jgi:hypothetical protein
VQWWHGGVAVRAGARLPRRLARALARRAVPPGPEAAGPEAGPQAGCAGLPPAARRAQQSAVLVLEVMAMQEAGLRGAPLALRVRRLWPDRNPLRRATDRAEFTVVLLLLAVFLAGAPLTALAAARWAAAAGLRSERAAGGVHQVPAVLLRSAPLAVGSLSTPVPWPQVPARWPSPAGPRTAKIIVPSGERAGSIVMVWVDRSGRLATPPAPAVTVTCQVLLAAVSAPAALSLVLLAAWVYAEMILGRRRMAAWEADWAVTGPQWTRGR